MKFLGLFDVTLRKKVKEPLKETLKQPNTLIMSVSEHLQKNPDWKVKLYHRQGAKYSPIDTLVVRDFAVVCADLEAYIREEYGAGDFRAAIVRPTGEQVASYEVPVGGPKAYKSNAGGIGTGNTDKAGRSGGRVSELMEFATFMKEMQGNDKIMEILLKQMELAAQNNQGGSGSEEILREVFTATFNNNLQREENQLNTMNMYATFFKNMQPQVAAEDSSTAIIQAIATAVGPALAAKFAGGGSPGFGNGGTDVQGLRQLLSSIPPEMRAALPPQQQAALDEFTGAGAPPPSILPRPGASPGQQVAAGGADPGFVAPPTPGSAPPSSENNTRHAMIDLMIEEMRQDIKAGKTDLEIAQKFLGLMGFARSCPPDDPHPMMIGLLNATEETQNAEFMRFCAAIPELGRDHERIERIGLELLNVIYDSASDTLDKMEAATGPEDEAQQTEVGAPEFAYETQEQAEQAQEGEQNAANVSEPSGVPEPGTRPPGREGGAGDAVSEEAGAAAEPDQRHAEAV